MWSIDLLNRERKTGQQDQWQLCFDEEKGSFAVCHTIRYKDSSGELITHSEKYPSELFKELITTKLKEMGFEKS